MDRTARYVSKFELCFTKSFKSIGNGAIRLVTYDFLLVFHCKYVSISHRNRYIILNLLPKI